MRVMLLDICLLKMPKTSPQLRIDWTNDRHQSIELPDTKPKSVVWALREAAGLLEQEIAEGKI